MSMQLDNVWDSIFSISHKLTNELECSYMGYLNYQNIEIKKETEAMSQMFKNESKQKRKKEKIWWLWQGLWNAQKIS